MGQGQLSEHFSFAELTVTAHVSLLEKNRFEAAAFVPALAELCAILLEPLRRRFGPVRVLSGYRCPALNAAVGGAANSQHLRGEAADITVPGVPTETVFDWARASLPGFGQLILEPGWLHVSLGQPYRPAGQCGQVLLFDGKIYRRLN